LVVLIALAVRPAAAHIVTEAPWHPVAAAYRTAVFLINLKPVDWQLIEHQFTTATTGESPEARLAALDESHDSAYWPAIAMAIAAKDPEGLYATATRAVSASIRRHLEAAELALDRPGEARAALESAQDHYRAFADMVQEADPENFRILGLAWLELASSVGHEGVTSVGGIAADQTAFAAARRTIEDYLLENYEAESFTRQARFAPLPEQRVWTARHLQVGPWLPPGSDLNDQEPLPRLVLDFEQRGIDEADLFLVAFGDMLFDSPEIFGEPAKSLGVACSTCHNRSDVNQRFFIPGISSRPGTVDVDGSFFNARFNDHRADALDIPSLRGLRFTAPYGRDGRVASLRDFTRNVIVNEFGGPEPEPMHLDALVAYMQEFNFLPAPYLDRSGRLTAEASESAERGEVLFNRPFPGMGDQSCADCHQPNSHFTDNEAHDIGSAGAGAADGFAGAMDTPPLLGIVHTAPYFHDGRFSTLGEVVAWFDQTFDLGLDQAERADLESYLVAVGTGQDAYEAFDDANTPFRLMMDELNTFLSTLDTLIPAQDGANADLLIRTVATDLEADASSMSNRTARGQVLALAESLWQIRDLVAQRLWDEAWTVWRAYQDTVEATNAEFF
jgi:cytochrome c peroxidase